MNQQGKDEKAWEIINRYFNDYPEIDKWYKEHHSPQKPPDVTGINAIYWRLLQSAQNASFRSNVIKLDHQNLNKKDSAEKWKEILFNFSPEKVIQEYLDKEGKYEVLKRTITTSFDKVLWLRTDKKSKIHETTWALFARCIIESAKFLEKFDFDELKFKDFITGMPSQFKYILPYAISSEIHGIGYALACDFIKECPGIGIGLAIGNFDISKPDVHLKEFCSSLDDIEYSQIEIVKRIQRFAQNVGNNTEYDIDKKIWSICAASKNAYKKKFLLDVKTIGKIN